MKYNLKMERLLFQRANLEVEADNPDHALELGEKAISDSKIDWGEVHVHEEQVLDIEEVK